MYKILYATDAATLERKVNDAFEKDGYIPTGGVAVIQNGIGSTFCQAVVGGTAYAASEQTSDDPAEGGDTPAKSTRKKS